LLTAHVIPPDADLDSQDAQIGRAVRAFLASGEGRVLDTSVGEAAEQCVAALGVLRPGMRRSGGSTRCVSAST
jgi:hypothetical protein